MAKYSRLRVLSTMVETGLVPEFFHRDIAVASHIVQALLEAGVRCIEFTNRGDQAHVVFGELVQRFQNDERAILGVGTVIDPGSAALFIQNGANFIAGPILNAEVAKICNLRKIAYLPGCGSASEISAAEELGVEIVILFPGSQLGGPDFVKAILRPMPWTYLMPTGGVEPSENNICSWFEAGVACVGMGSNLVRKDLVAAGNYKAITEIAAQTLKWIGAMRQEYPIFY